MSTSSKGRIAAKTLSGGSNVAVAELAPFSSLQGASRPNRRRARKVSLVIRRTHMYIALFFTPWLAMYALSTIFFNHLPQVNRLSQKMYGPAFDKYVLEKQLVYNKPFRESDSVRARAEQILTDLHLNGSFGVEKLGNQLEIDRRDPFIPRRIVFDPATHRLVIERQDSHLASLLTMLHTQVTYTNKLKRIKVWALFVDLTVLIMLLLVFSGAWMWWELKVTRFTGSVFLVVGISLFGLFLFLT